MGWVNEMGDKGVEWDGILKKWNLNLIKNFSEQKVCCTLIF